MSFKQRCAAWSAAAVAAALIGGWMLSGLEAGRIAAAYPPTGRLVAVGNSRIHITERDPTGVPRGTVVLLHGASGNQADVMVALGDRLAAQGFRVLAPDRPGHGWSDRPDGAADASPARQAALLHEALTDVGVTHAIVLGHSWSGALAEAFALHYPAFTIGLVLVSPVTHPWSTGVGWYFRWAASPIFGPLFNRLVAMPVGLEALDPGIRSVFHPQEPPPHFAERTGLYLLLRPGEFMANAQDVAQLEGFVAKQAPHESEIKVPTAIVTGDSDDIVSTRIHAFASHDAIPGATLTVLPGVGHSPHWADPQAVVAAVLDVARRAGLGGAGTTAAAAP